LSNDVARIAEFSDTLEISTVSSEEMGVGWLGELSGREAPESLPVV
jgi:hypothetical protein